MKVEGVVSLGTHSGGDGPQAAHNRVQGTFIPLILFLYYFESTWENHQASISLLENQQKSQMIFNGINWVNWGDKTTPPCKSSVCW